jgi:hypothetical protein
VKKLFFFSVFLLTVVFAYTVTLQDLLLLKKSNDISLSEIIQCFLDDDITTLVKIKFQNCTIHSPLFIVNSSLPTGNFSYQSETAGHIQPKKAILRL